MIVGAGLFGSVFANEAYKKGKKCLVIDRREHIGGNSYTEEKHGIQVHRYGAHIFHTHNKRIWNYVQQFAEFNHFINTPMAKIGNEIYNLPFNMNTFSQMWGTITPDEAMEKLNEQRSQCKVESPRNLEEQALNLVGRDVYEKLIKGYTEKQWGRACTELPAFIIRRLPVRFTYDNNYFTDPYQGIPIGGYTEMVENMLCGIEVKLNVDYISDRAAFCDIAKKTIYTGAIDEYYEYCYGALEYRSLRFETDYLPETANYQGVAVVNYTDSETPYTRIIEHKHFEFGEQPGTVITREYPDEWKQGDEAYYPVNDEKNQALYEKYKALAEAEREVLFGGRLGTYRYLDMDDVVEEALGLAGW